MVRLLCSFIFHYKYKVTIRNRNEFANLVDGEYFGPYEYEHGSQIFAVGLQQLENVGKYSHAQSQVDRPRSHVEEAAEEVQRLQPMHLTQQHLVRYVLNQHLLSILNDKACTGFF